MPFGAIAKHNFSQLPPSRKRPPLVQDRVIAYEKNQQNKPNVGMIASSIGLTDQLHKDITLSARIGQIETKLFDFLHMQQFSGKTQ